MNFLKGIAIIVAITVVNGQGCTFNMYTGDVTATEAHFQASLRQRECRKDPSSVFADTVVQMSKTRDFSTLMLNKTMRVTKYARGNVRVRPGEYVARLHVFKLLPKSTYYYRFFDEFGKISPTGIIRTLQAPDDDSELLFLHMSCANVAPYPISGALRDYIVANKPNFNIFNGDLIYADRVWYDPNKTISNENRCCRFPNVTQQYYHDIYGEQREDAYTGEGFHESLYSTPTFPLFDDHEVTDDFAGNKQNPRILFRNPVTDEVLRDVGQAEAIQYTRFGRKAFFTAVSLQTPSRIRRDTGVKVFNENRRIFRSFRANKDVEIFILDLRSYREPLDYVDTRVPVKPQGVPDNFSCDTTSPGFDEAVCDQLTGKEFIPDYRTRRGRVEFLGESQRKWIREGLLNSKAKFKIVVSSVVMLEFFYNPPDRWEAYWDERREFLDFIETNNIENVVILTGDYHASIYSQVNPGKTPPVYEFTTGSIGNLTRQIGSPSQYPNTDRDFYNWFSYWGGNGHLFPEGERPVKYMLATEANFMAVRVKDGKMTLQTLDANGNVAFDLGGRKGEFVLE